MSNGRTLPLEILTDILSRNPVKSLYRFKGVSHSWKSLISDPHFAKTHLNRTKTTNPQYLDQKIILLSWLSNSDHNPYSIADLANANPIATKLDFPMVVQSDNWVQLLSSYDGLLLVSPYDNPNKSDFSLFNPSTRECKKLPAPPFLHNPVPGDCWYVYGVGYNSSTDDYYVVTLSSHRTKSMVANIYSLNANAWRRIVDARCDLVGTSWGVFFNGCLHCLCWRNGSNAVLAFNLSDEIFREVPLPASLAGCKMGCLDLVERRAYPTDIWMMEEYGVVESWTKFSIDLHTRLPRLTLLCWLPEDNFLFDNSRRTVGKKLVVYNSKKRNTNGHGGCWNSE